jgi:hypothetical protein
LQAARLRAYHPCCKMHRADALKKFVAYGESLAGYEKGEAQVFLDRMFQAFGHAGYHEAGASLEFRVKRGVERTTSFVDLVWKPIVLIEMKRRGEDLSKHYRQAFDDWVHLVPLRSRWVVLCNFDEFWVFDFETQMDTPRAKLKLSALSTAYGPLAFLFSEPEEPIFVPDSQAVTRQAAEALAGCFSGMIGRGTPRDAAQRFTLQTLTALFAQSIGLLERYMVTRVLEDCQTRPKDAFDLLGQLFTEMNTPGRTAGGRFKGVSYFNGGLFAAPARIELTGAEVEQLLAAAASDWSQVRLEIFGTIFERSLGANERHMTGAHFTSPADIMKIVGPTIVDPWSTLIENATTQRDLRKLHVRMQHYKVLDPACGSGNFLYISYRELKRLEARIFARIKELSTKQEKRQTEFGFVTAAQFFGIDSNPFAVELAKVTMMLGRKLAIDELQITEEALPLDNLDKNFRAIDAIVHSSGSIPAWEPVDVIIGNPPFLDARKITIEHGRSYTDRLRAAYPEIPGRADYCVYWFRRAHDAIPAWSETDPVSGRAGLVGTKTIRQNYTREGGLDYIVAHAGVIVDAVSWQSWSGDAAVDVSIVNWVKGEFTGKRILQEQVGPARGGGWKREVVSTITSALTDRTDVAAARELAVVTRKKRCFEGQQPGHTGFRISAEKYIELARKDPMLGSIAFQYMIGASLLTGKYESSPEFLIDFDDKSILEAAKHGGALAHIKKTVLPTWEDNARQEEDAETSSTGEHRRRVKVWWQLKRRRAEMLAAIGGLSRYIVCVRHTMRPIFEFLDSAIRPDSALTVFAFEDDYSFGILQSDVHWQWFTARCSSLSQRFRYTSETVFDAFAWPQNASHSDIKAVATSARRLREVRSSFKMRGGLRALYRTLEDLPGESPLREAHDALNAAVMQAYGFSAERDVLAQLLELNHLVADRSDAIGPGLPPGVRRATSLVSEDRIKPVVLALPSWSK